VHLVDGAVMPTIASSTFTLTVMANAHRIATGVLAGAATTRACSVAGRA
jgi:choline dehydrogenase-like flavoprotein